jgi:hypothetical protein
VGGEADGEQESDGAGGHMGEKAWAGSHGSSWRVGVFETGRTNSAAGT